MSALGLSIPEIIVTVVVIALVLWAARRSGQQNPVGTGELAKEVSELRAIVGRHGLELSDLKSSVLDMTDASAESSQILAALRLEIAGDRGLTERTWSAVDRLQQFFIQQAFEQRPAK